MTSDFDAWVSQVAPRDAREPGTRAAGVEGRLREIFDERGPISVDELRAEGEKIQIELAREAVALVLRDVHATTGARPRIEIRRDAEYGLIVSYNGGWSTPAIMSMQNPEATCEIAEYLQGEVMEDSSAWGVWPTCPTHKLGTYPQVLEDTAVWFCRIGNHSVTTIGQLKL